MNIALVHRTLPTTSFRLENARMEFKAHMQSTLDSIGPFTHVWMLCSHKVMHFAVWAKALKGTKPNTDGTLTVSEILPESTNFMSLDGVLQLNDSLLQYILQSLEQTLYAEPFDFYGSLLTA